MEVRAVATDWSRDDVVAFYGRWGHRDLGGFGQLVLEGNWAGDNPTVRPFNPKDACGRALGQIYVLWDGRVSTCCFDPDGKQVFGDLRVASLRDVYNSPRYVAFREAHYRNQADLYDICRNCTRI
jgi:radical SAM protein with 4Fe4S-binding SPASM domain